MKVAMKNPKLVVDEKSKDFAKWKDTILLDEEILLEALAFDLTLDSPYELLSQYVDILNISNLSVRKGAWAFVNDSCRTMLSIMFPTKVIAMAAIHWAAKIDKSPIPGPKNWKNEGFEEGSELKWWEYPEINGSISDIMDASKVMLDFYESQTNEPLVQTSSHPDAKRKTGTHENEPLVKKPRIDS